MGKLYSQPDWRSFLLAPNSGPFWFRSFGLDSSSKLDYVNSHLFMRLTPASQKKKTSYTPAIICWPGLAYTQSSHRQLRPAQSRLPPVLKHGEKRAKERPLNLQPANWSQTKNLPTALPTGKAADDCVVVFGAEKRCPLAPRLWWKQWQVWKKRGGWQPLRMHGCDTRMHTDKSCHVQRILTVRLPDLERW